MTQQNKIVSYRLTEVDITSIGQRGNVVKPGDVLPMIIVKDFGNGSVNGQVFLDGQGTYFVNTRAEGQEVGNWFDPIREENRIKLAYIEKLKVDTEPEQVEDNA